MTYTTDQAIALAREVGAIDMHPYDYGAPVDRAIIIHEQLTALCNAVRKQTLLEAAEYCDVAGHFTQAGLMRFMAGVV